MPSATALFFDGWSPLVVRSVFDQRTNARTHGRGTAGSDVKNLTCVVVDANVRREATAAALAEEHMP